MSHGHPEDRLLTRSHVKDVALVVLSALVLYGCWLLLEPFFAPLIWAMALAVVARPMQSRLEAHLRPTVAAFLGLTVIVIVLIGPVAFVIQQIISEARHALPQITEAVRTMTSMQENDQPPWVRMALTWVDTRVDLNAELQKVGGRLASWASSFLGSSVSAVTQWVVMLFTLYYFLRDHARLIRALQNVLPLSDQESDTLFHRVSETIYATLQGNIVVKLAQGTLTGVMFWILGLPMPVLFGAATSFVALLPMIGTAFIWGPAAIWLAVHGMWIKAIILAAWGGLMVSMVDNFLYPWMVASELKLHPLGVFFSVFGGMIAFGLVGMIVGPVIVAVATALLQVWRMRLASEPSQS